MKKNTILCDNLELINSKLLHKYTTDFSIGFHYIELVANSYEESRVLEQNAIFFLISGSCSFSYDQYTNRVYHAGDMLFFPKSAIVTGHVLEDAKFMFLNFDMPSHTADSLLIANLYKDIDDIEYDARPLKMNSSIDIFIDSLIYLLQNCGDTLGLNEIKERELFFILRMYYTRKELVEFFFPIVGQSFDFKNFVLENHHKCKRLIDLIQLSNLCPNVFMRKFKKEFGISGYQWMLQQMCKKILHKAAQSDITIKEIMSEVGIDSSSHFNKICKKHFNMTPTELISVYKTHK